MGQSSLPILNKVGVSMRWDSSYDNLLNFKKTMLSDIFLKKFFDFVFEDKFIFIFFKFFFSKNNKFKKFGDILKKKKKRIPSYCSKIWFLKYQAWVVVSFYLYIPKVFLKKSLKLKKIRINNNLSFFKFIINNNKNLYKNDLYKYLI